MRRCVRGAYCRWSSRGREATSRRRSSSGVTLTCWCSINQEGLRTERCRTMDRNDRCWPPHWCRSSSGCDGWSGIIRFGRPLYDVSYWIWSTRLTSEHDVVRWVARYYFPSALVWNLLAKNRIIHMRVAFPCLLLVYLINHVLAVRTAVLVCVLFVPYQD